MIAIKDLLTTEDIKYLGAGVSLYIPLPGNQKQFHEDKSEIKWLLGGNKSGKSYANLMDLAMLALGVHPFRHIENGTIWVCSETWEMAKDILWIDYLEKFIPSKQIAHIDWGYAHCPSKVYLKNGNIIEFKAFSQGRKLFQGRSIDACYADEQCLSDFQAIFNEIQARLMLKKGFLSWSMTPIVAQPFLEDRIANLPDTDAVFYLNLNDNRISKGGYVDDKRIDQMIAEWPIEVQQTRVEGKFAAFVGSVYKSYSKAVHVIESFPIPENWDRWRAVDFGFSNPLCCLWIARDGDNRFYVYKEHYQSQTVVSEHIQSIKKLSGKEKYRATWADPENAEGRDQFRKAGITTKKAQKSVALGIEAVQSYLKVRGDGDPGLFIFSNCKNTIREISSYRYPTGSRNRDASDHPIKKDDHTLDCLRYCLYSVTKTRVKGRAILITS